MADFPPGSHNWCPVCHTELVNVDKHLKTVHNLKASSHEQKILCTLGTDRIPVGGELVRCPLFRQTGCLAQILNPKHHLRNTHPGITAEQMVEALRPLRFRIAMTQLQKLRTSKTENMMTDLDILYIEDRPALEEGPPTSCRLPGCVQLRQEVKTLRKVNLLLRRELSKLQKEVQTFGTIKYREAYCNQLYYYM